MQGMFELCITAILRIGRGKLFELAPYIGVKNFENYTQRSKKYNFARL